MNTKAIKVNSSPWHPRPRVFIEAVDGCDNQDCTSKCGANKRCTKFMSRSNLKYLVDTFRGVENLDTYLFGSGDSSLYPFEECDIDFTKTITNVIGKYRHRVVPTKHLGITTYLRYNTLDEVLDSPDYRYIDGGILVISKNDTWYPLAVRQLLSKNVPVLIRSLFVPIIGGRNMVIPPDEVIHSVGISPSTVLFHTWACQNCKVAVVYEHNGDLWYRRCGRHKITQRIIDINETVSDIIEWDGTKQPIDACSDCSKSGLQYRMYFEPLGG